MSKVTKLHPDNSPGRKLLEETLGEIAVEDGFKLPETAAELELYERRNGKDDDQRTSRFNSIHEALADAEKTTEIRYRQRDLKTTTGTSDLAARNGDEIDPETLDMMDVAADEDDDD